jgi:hypothetical protein
MSPWHISEWATNVTITYNWVSNKCHNHIVMVTFVAHSVICHGDICCSLSYMWWWHLLFTQLYVMVTFVAHSVITYNWVSNKIHHDIKLSEQQMSPWHITKWATNVTITYNWVSNKCHNHIFCCSLSYMSSWQLLLTQLYVIVTFVAHSVICHGDICCSLSYMWLWHSYNWVNNKCRHDI